MGNGDHETASYRPTLVIETEGVEVTISDVTVNAVTGVGFTGEVNRIYRLQSADSPASGTWEDTPLLLEGTGEAMTAFDPAGPATQKVYRVLQL